MLHQVFVEEYGNIYIIRINVDSSYAWIFLVYVLGQYLSSTNKKLKCICYYNFAYLAA